MEMLGITMLQDIPMVGYPISHLDIGSKIETWLQDEVLVWLVIVGQEVDSVDHILL